MIMEALLGMTIYHRGNIYGIIDDTCDNCAMRRNNGRCWGVCSRFINFNSKRFAFEFKGKFHPRHLKEITFTSIDQNRKVHADYQQEISEYYHITVEEVLSENWQPK